MMPIRKLLSRKFNIVCLNLAGLLTCFYVALPSHPTLRTVVLEEATSLLQGVKPSLTLTYSCGNSSGLPPDSLLITQPEIV